MFALSIVSYVRTGSTFLLLKPQATQQQSKERITPYSCLLTTLQPCRPAAAGSHVRAWQVHMRGGLRCIDMLILYYESDRSPSNNTPALCDAVCESVIAQHVDAVAHSSTPATDSRAESVLTPS